MSGTGDIMDTNPYTSATAGNTYGVQSMLMQFREKQQQAKRAQEMMTQDQIQEDPPDQIVMETDPIYSNRIEKINPEMPPKIAARVVREKIRLISISSSMRQK